MLTDPESPQVHELTADELLAVNEPAATAAPSTPPPSPAAPPPPASAPAAAPVNEFAGVKDSRGVEFHPAKFRVKDGRPQLDTKGRFVPLGLGAKPKAGEAGSVPAQGEASAPASQLPPDDATTAAAEAVEFSAEMGVEVAINLIQTALIVIGEDEGILDDLEKKMLRAPLLRVLAKYNLSQKMTPEMEAAAVVAVIVMRRLKKPKTMGWFQQRLAWLFAWWKSMKLRRAVSDPIPVTAS